MKRQPWFWPVKLFLKRVSGRELWLRTDTRSDVLQSDGWDYIAELLGPHSIVYSLGVGDSIDFDIDLIHHYSLTVHAFDPTPYSEEWISTLELPSNFQFHAWAAAGKDGVLRLYRRINKRGRKSKVMWTADNKAGDTADFVDVPAFTLRTMMRNLGHYRIDLLKVDIEGAEYDILDGLPEMERLPVQLLVEFHHRFPGIGKRRTVESIEKLRKLGYVIASISETGREVSFVLKHAV